MTLIGLQELPRLRPESVHVGANRDTGYLNGGPLPDFVLEIAINNRSALQLDELY
jgi:hypothetical protein